MEIRQLRYFVAVAEERHFRRAAARLHVAQPAVSEQIRKLEAELDVQLLLRTSREVVVTAAGTAFLDEARHVLDGLDGAVHVARRARAAGTARVRLGYSLPALPPAVTRALGRLGTASAPIDVDLMSAPSRALLERVRRGRLDAAVVCLPAPTAGLRVLSLCREPLVAVLPGRAGLPVAPLPVAALAARSLLLGARELDPACHDATLAVFHAAGAVPDVVHSTATTLEQLLLEVLGGAGVAALPASAAARGGLSGVVTHPIAGASVAVTMGVVARDEPASPVLRALLDELGRAVEKTTPAPVVPVPVPALVEPVAA